MKSYFHGFYRPAVRRPGDAADQCPHRHRRDHLKRLLHHQCGTGVDSGPGSSRPTNYPAYFARASYDGVTVYAEVNHHCVDCREYKNSTAEKPDFW